jgi:branched-chain amino acid transport system permease protein
MMITIWSGVTLGAVYALVAVGFTLTMLPTGVFNFAQGALVIGGTFMAYQWMTASGLGEIPALLINAALGAVGGLACEVFAVRPLRFGLRRLTGTSELVTTVGMSTLLIGVIGIKWGYQALQVPFKGPTALVHFLGIGAMPIEIIVLALAIVLSLVLHFWFRLTRLGQACLAVAEDRDAATLRGVNVNLLSLGAFAAAGAIGAVVGALTGPITYAIPTLGTSLALGGFVAIALGGEGSFIGGLIGGLLVGLASAFATRYINANYGDLAVLALLMVTLALRPRGLGGISAARHV